MKDIEYFDIKENIKRRRKVQKNLKLTIDDINKLNDHDIILISYNFLCFSIAYYKLINHIDKHKIDYGML